MQAVPLREIATNKNSFASFDDMAPHIEWGNDGSVPGARAFFASGGGKFCREDRVASGYQTNEVCQSVCRVLCCAVSLASACSINDPGRIEPAADATVVRDGGGLDASALDGGTPDPARPLNADQALAYFAACMRYDDWDATGMDRLAFELTDRAPCYGCHADGTGGTFLSTDSRETFDRHHEPAYLAQLVAPKVDEDGGFIGLEPARRYVEAGSEAGIHPSYVLSEAGSEAVETFFDRTYARYSDLACNEPPEM